jgi:outer membrane protein, heavy metal efflux system
MHFDHPTGSAAPLLVSVVLAMLVALGSSFAAAQPVDVSAPGATVDELLDMGRRLNPGLAGAALNAQAAAARIGTAGRFPDPTFRTELWDVRAARDTGLPQAPGQVKYTVEQTVPLWGKRDLQRGIARAEAGSASEQRRAVETALLARIKTVFAGSWGTQETIRITRELLDSVFAIARVAESRYGQGRGNQQDVVTAEVERGAAAGRSGEARR